MFTGIVQAVGRVVDLKRTGSGAELVVETGLPPEWLHTGDSIAVDGCCQTIAAFSGGRCSFHCLNETLSRTVFGEYCSGRAVNIEPAMQAGGRFGGHIVQGHVDCTGVVAQVAPRSGDIALTLRRPPAEAFPLVEKGSIAVGGVSLTVAELTAQHVTVCIIPHTWEHTALRLLKAGSRVNLEADLIGKYVAAMLEPHRPGARVTMEQLREAGF